MSLKDGKRNPVQRTTNLDDLKAPQFKELLMPTKFYGHYPIVFAIFANNNVLHDANNFVIRFAIC